MWLYSYNKMPASHPWSLWLCETHLVVRDPVRQCRDTCLCYFTHDKRVNAISVVHSYIIQNIIDRVCLSKPYDLPALKVELICTYSSFRQQKAVQRETKKSFVDYDSLTLSISHPLMPVMRKMRLPLILVQLTNFSMLLESTVWAVWRLPVPIPSHTEHKQYSTCLQTEHHTYLQYYQMPLEVICSLGNSEAMFLLFGQMSVHGMHILMSFSSTSILLLGQARTHELWSTTKLSEENIRKLIKEWSR